MVYQPRIVDQELDELLGGLSAVALEGPKAVGKTETAQRRAATMHRLDDPAQLELIRAAPERLTSGEPPVVIDEWQRLPTSWDLVRRSVDHDPSPARFILTGSAVPADAPAHSGAGRIVTVRMRPMSLAERGIETPTVRLRDLLSGTKAPVEGSTTLALETYADEITRSGFPAIRQLSGRHLRAQLDGYIDRIVEREFIEAGHKVRNTGALRRWLAAYAAASSDNTSFEKIRDAATSGEGDKPSKASTIPYRATLEQLWILEEVPAWIPSLNRLRRLATSPVHQLTDPALAARLLGVDAEALIDGAPAGPPSIRDGTLLGALFESLVTQSVRVYAQANEARVRHLRTRGSEREVDLIVERDDGRIVALEIKLTATVTDGDVRHLHWLAGTIGDNLLDAAVITTGKDAYRRSDGIAVVPAGLLTA
ncbi:ATP-binding protein [Candidatus Poriferisocius sp.]|uniref:ATP-binding protein n=1 Tax=Candidatus Poriferisocius sp. TaxID=3101276 RepID=UPI003B59500D